MHSDVRYYQSAQMNEFQMFHTCHCTKVPQAFLEHLDVDLALTMTQKQNMMERVDFLKNKILLSNSEL